MFTKVQQLDKTDVTSVKKLTQSFYLSKRNTSTIGAIKNPPAFTDVFIY